MHITVSALEYFKWNKQCLHFGNIFYHRN